MLKPCEYVGIQTYGHQFLWRTTELGELLIGESPKIGMVDLRSDCASSAASPRPGASPFGVF
jgi:hypothetical protein